MKIFLACLTLLLTCLGVSAQQERIMPLHSNPAIKKYLNDHPKPKSTNNKRIAISNDTLQLPIVDDFSYDGVYPNPKFWSDSDVFVNRDFPINPPTLGVATFDGLDKWGNPYNPAGGDSIADHLTSNYINLNYPTDTTIWLSFFYQPQGNSYYPPYPDDSLILEFQYPNDTITPWREIWSVPGTIDTVFQQVMIQVDTPYLNSSFRFRFSNIASLQGAVDQWNIDYVRLDRNRYASDTSIAHDGAFLYRNKSLLVPPYTSMPYSHYKTNPSMYTVTSEIEQYKNLTAAILNLTKEFRITIDDTIYKADSATALIPGVAAYSTAEYTEPLPNFSLPVTSQSSLEYTTWNIQTISDNYPQNDTVKEAQVLSNYYSYDDGTAEAAYGIWTANDNSSGSLAERFDLIMPDTLRGVEIFWDQIPEPINTHNQLLNIAVWDQLTPNTNNSHLLYQIVDTEPANDSTINGFYTYVFDSPLAVSGTIYIGWIQYEQAYLNVGFDFNTDTHNLLYYNTLDLWQQSNISGSVMIRPLFGGVLPTGVNEIPKTDFTASVFPNPASDVINISIKAKHPSSYSFQLFDVIGKLVTEQKGTVINTSALEDGFYMLKITDDKTSQFVTNKIIIRH